MTQKSSPKNEVAEAPKKVEATLAAPAVIAGTTALAKAGASQELIESMNEVKDNMSTVENFVLPKIKATAQGLELMEGEPIVMEIEGTILHAKKLNVYYENPFNPNKIEPPTCFSHDGTYPDASIVDPQNKTCKGCPMAEFGTNSMKSGKACRNLKPLFIRLSDTSIMPKQLAVSPTSLKAVNNYLMNLTELGLSFRKVKTKITAYKDNPKDTYVKLKFSKGAKLTDQQAADAEFLRNQWLSIMDAQVIDQGTTEPVENTGNVGTEPVYSEPNMDL